MSGSLEDGNRSCEGETSEGRRSGRNVSKDGEGEGKNVAMGDESGDKGDDGSTHASQAENEMAMVEQGAAVRAGEVSEPGD